MNTSSADSNVYVTPVGLAEQQVERAEQGRVRNARIAAVAVTVAFVVALLATVAVYGWFDVSASLRERNNAVEVLTEQAQHQAERAHQQEQIDTCQDEAFADVVALALAGEDPQPDDLSRAYAECRKKFGG